ncbi:probable glycosyltransferase At5g25310 [Salvia miltiorrhiza]|uniref:probable glycosyltransferase At5g25310 n=1 Tax=Salvia miltiorrhiza TaxID=226208 RepID=UPI0025AD7BDB|nr:probable glycosyltransferase At5g25310 [Salvia miltiorrhiza]
MAMRIAGGVTFSIVVVSAVIVAVFFISGYFSGGADSGLWRSYSDPEAEFKKVQLVGAARRRGDEPRAVVSAEIESRFKPISRKRESGKLEEGLARARAAVRRVASIRNKSVIIDGNHIISSSSIYRNPSAFLQSYKEMERRLKVYVYEEGEVPIVHDGPCKDIYTSEGRFIHEMEHGRHRFRTSRGEEAHLYFMPFSVTWMVKYLYKPNTYDLTPLQEFVSDYVKLISTKHPFWNTSQGADHFMLSCHDWGPRASEGNAYLYNTSIRALCNANTSEGFSPQKDVSLPEIHLYGGYVNPKLITPPPPTASSPSYLAFFAGGLHGPVRPILLHHWKGRDPDLHIYEYLPKHLDYYDYMLKSKFCLCPSGYEVASPRIVEAIYAECIPVILSDHYVLPFSDVLRWEAFSLQVNISEIPRLKEILMAVTEDEFLRLKEGLRAIRKHFVLNQPAERFDMFHMILHSVWLRRLNLRI